MRPNASISAFHRARIAGRMRAMPDRATAPQHRPDIAVPARRGADRQRRPGATVPPVSPQAAAAGFVDVRTVVPDAVIDLRYATAHNFVGVPLYPADARCLVHESMAPGLAKAADELRAQGDVLVFWDCYRPHDVQVRMFDAVPNPAWVAKPGPYARSHETGRSVDVTIAERGQLVDMGTDFDDFSARAQAYATDGVSAPPRPTAPGCAPRWPTAGWPSTPANGGISTDPAPASSARSSTCPSTRRPRVGMR